MHPLLILLTLCAAEPVAERPSKSNFDDRTVIVVANQAELRDPTTKKVIATIDGGEQLYERDIIGEEVEAYYLWFRFRVVIDRNAVMSVDDAYDFFSKRIEEQQIAADYADRASIWMLAWNFEKAEDDLNEAIRLNPTLPRAYERRSLCRCERAYRAREPDQYNEWLRLALVDAEKQLQLAPNDYRAHLSKATVLSNSQGDESIESYRSVTKLEPRCLMAYNNRAKLLFDKGKPDEVLSDLNKAIELDPEYSDAYTNRAIIFHRRRQFDKAIADGTKAVEFNPLNVSAWNNRGNTYMELKEYDKAIADFSEVIRITNGSPDAFFGRANVYFLMGEKDPAYYHKSMTDVEAALKINPTDYKVLNTKGNILKKLNKPRDAVLVFDAAIAAIRTEARQYPAESDMVRAWNAVETLLKIDQDHMEVAREDYRWAAAYPQRGTIAAILGNRADAHNEVYKLSKDPKDERAVVDDISRAIVFDVNNPQFWFVRAQFHQKNHKPGEAMFDLNQTLRASPDHVEALKNRARLACFGAQYDIAWQDAKKLRDLGQPLDDETLKKLREASGKDYPK